MWMGDKKQCMFINENHPFALAQPTRLQQAHAGKTLLWAVHKLYIFT